MRTVVIIPALNEETSLPLVLRDIPAQFRDRVFVVDNGSKDSTARVAKAAGAHVISEPQRGYGAACLAGIRQARDYDPELVVFLDADYSDFPEEMCSLIDKLIDDDLDMVIGSRIRRAERGALLPQARIGNSLATFLLALRFGYRFTDLGPFRVIRWKALEQLKMQDTNFGWTMEMQIKALRQKLRVGEVSVRYRSRVGVSKITGTFKGTFLAGYKILWTLFRYSF